MTYVDELSLTGPKTFYEKLVLSLNTDELVEFLVAECHHKDRYIKLLEHLINQELGENWWQMYADHITAQHSVLAANYLDAATRDQAFAAASDIPL